MTGNIWCRHGIMSESVLGPLLRDNFKLNSPILEDHVIEFIVIEMTIISVANERPGN